MNTITTHPTPSPKPLTLPSGWGYINPDGTRVTYADSRIAELRRQARKRRWRVIRGFSGGAA